MGCSASLPTPPKEEHSVRPRRPSPHTFTEEDKEAIRTYVSLIGVYTSEQTEAFVASIEGNRPKVVIFWLDNLLYKRWDAIHAPSLRILARFLRWRAISGVLENDGDKFLLRDRVTVRYLLTIAVQDIQNGVLSRDEINDTARIGRNNPLIGMMLKYMLPSAKDLPLSVIKDFRILADGLLPSSISSKMGII